MSYQAFQEKIIARIGHIARPRFFYDSDKGMYRAVIPGELEFTGNSISKKITVNFGDNHTSQF